MREALKYPVAKALTLIMPQRTHLIRENFTLPYWHPALRNNRIDRLIRWAIAQEASADDQQLENLHRDFWRQSSRGWFQATSQRQDALDRSRFLEALGAAAATTELRQVCELGTGNGRFLAQLAQQLGDTYRYIGVDLNAEQMRLNQQTFPQLSFVASDGLEWLQHEAAAMLLVTNGGVLEYFSETSVKTLMTSLAQRPGALLALSMEPLDPTHDLETMPHSHAFGSERSFSHNYPQLATACGLKLLHCESFEHGRHRLIDLIASA